MLTLGGGHPQLPLFFSVSNGATPSDSTTRWDPCQWQPPRSVSPAWPLLTMPCLTIQSLRLFSPLPPIWVRKGQAEGGGKGRARAPGVPAALSSVEASLRSAGR